MSENDPLWFLIAAWPMVLIWYLRVRHDRLLHEDTLRVVPYKEWASQQLADISRKMLAVGDEIVPAGALKGYLSQEFPEDAWRRMQSALAAYGGAPRYGDWIGPQWVPQGPGTAVAGGGGGGSNMVSTASYPGEARAFKGLTDFGVTLSPPHDDSVDASAWAKDRRWAEMSNPDSYLPKHAKTCSYCGSTAYHMHKFRGRAVCSGCGQFWGET